MCATCVCACFVVLADWALMYTNIWLYRLAYQTLRCTRERSCSRGNASEWVAGQKKVHEHPFRALIFHEAKIKTDYRQAREVREREQDVTRSDDQSLHFYFAIIIVCKLHRSCCFPSALRPSQSHAIKHVSISFETGFSAEVFWARMCGFSNFSISEHAPFMLLLPDAFWAVCIYFY